MNEYAARPGDETVSVGKSMERLSGVACNDGAERRSIGNNTAKTPAKAPPSEDYLRCPVDWDDLSAFRLRTSVSSISIWPLWQSMQRLGWTHSNSTRMYRAPSTRRRRRRQALPTASDRSGPETLLCENDEEERDRESEWEWEDLPGEVVGDSLAVGEVLDRHSIPTDDWSVMPPPTDASLLEEDEDARRRRRWRDDLLGDYYRLVKYRKQKKCRSSGCSTLFSMDDDSPRKKKTTTPKRSKKQKGAASSMSETRKRKFPIVPTPSSGAEGKGASQQDRSTRAGQSKRAKNAKESVKDDAEEKKDPDEKAEDVKAANADRMSWPEPAKCVEAVRSIIEADENSPSIETQEQLAIEEHRGNFSEWSFLLSTGHNLLLYGFGSKRAVLEAFCSETLSAEGETVVVNGYDHSITINEVLDALVCGFLGGVEPSPASEVLELSGEIPFDVGGLLPAVRRATAIARAIASSTSSEVAARSSIRWKAQPQALMAAFLVLHNVDGPGLRTAEAQFALAALITHGNGVVRIAASVDHINAAAVLWDRKTSEKLAWIWNEIHTHLPYLEEVSLGVTPATRKVRFGSSRLPDNGGILNVLSAIAPRHTECLQVLASLQRFHGERVGSVRSCNGGNKGNDFREAAVAYKKWMSRCVSEMKARSDQGLREILRELTDHGVVEKSRDEEHGTEMVHIPYSDTVLNLILDFKRT